MVILKINHMVNKALFNKIRFQISQIKYFHSVKIKIKLNFLTKILIIRAINKIMLGQINKIV